MQRLINQTGRRGHALTLWIAGAVILTGAAVTGVSEGKANGFGEDRPYDFRSANDRAVALNAERTRLEKRGDLGVGGAGGLGTVASQGGEPTANRSEIIINGDGNTLNVTQDSVGDQNTNNALEGGVNGGN